MPLFPTLAGKPCGYVNLDDLARRIRAPVLKSNPFVWPNSAQRYIDEFHERMGWAWSYGGYMEKRTTLWETVPYLEINGTFIHRGIDCNVPAGTPVATTRPVVVEHIDDDAPEPFGWGKRVIVRLKTEPIYLIYAHLGEVRCKVGQSLTLNTYLGVVGEPEVNGGWFPHLHVQVLTHAAWTYYRPRLHELDGYGAEEVLIKLGRECPDPLPYLRMW